MEKKNLAKFIFMLIVGVIVLITSIYSFFGEKKDVDDVEDLFKNEDPIDDNFDVDFDEITLPEADEDVDENAQANEKSERTDEDEVNNPEYEGHEHYETINEEFNYEKKYTEQFGEENVRQSLNITKNFMPLYVEKKDKVAEYKKHVSSDYYSSLIDGMKARKETAKQIDSVDVFATEQVNEDEMIVGCIVNYDGKTEYLNVVFKEKDGFFLINNVVSMWVN